MSLLLQRQKAIESNPDLKKVLAYMFLLAGGYAAKHGIKLEEVDIKLPLMTPSNEVATFLFCHKPPDVSDTLLDAYGNPARLN